MLLEAIEKEGDHPLPGDSDSPTLDIPQIAEDAPDEEWEKLAERLRPIYFQIATGAQDANPTQRQAIEHILNRAYGRAGAAREQEAVDNPVIILPCMGDAAIAHVCPVCAYYVGLSRERVVEMLDEVDRLLASTHEAQT
jgi:hypothetical protein